MEIGEWFVNRSTIFLFVGAVLFVIPLPGTFLLGAALIFTGVLERLRAK